MPSWRKHAGRVQHSVGGWLKKAMNREEHGLEFDVYSGVLANLQPVMCDPLDCVTGGGDAHRLWTRDEVLLEVDVFGTPQSDRR